MSYGASRKRALDPAFPLGIRVLCLCECLDRFSPFGFQRTRERLRAMTGATGAGWTQEQVVGSVRLLDEARGSWRAYQRAGEERRRVAKRTRERVPSLNDDRVAWLRAFFTGDTAVRWRVAGLGDCATCGHEMLLHAGRCAACLADDVLAWDSPDWCTERLP